jgi:ACS family hexuronate transporter-like MFS transporter
MVLMYRLAARIFAPPVFKSSGNVRHGFLIGITPPKIPNIGDLDSDKRSRLDKQNSYGVRTYINQISASTSRYNPKGCLAHSREKLSWVNLVAYANASSAQADANVLTLKRQTGGALVLTTENRLLGVLALGGAVAAFDAQALYYLAPFLSRDLHLSNTKIGLVSSIVVVTWAISAYVVGSISDRFGKRKYFLIAAFITFAICSGLSGLATSFAMLFGARALIGIAEGPVIPISLSIMMAESSPHRRGFNMGVVQNLGAQLIGAMLGPLIVVKLATTFSWHAAFYIAGVPGLLVASLIAVSVREPVLAPKNLPPALQGALLANLRELWSFRNIRVCVLVCCFVLAWYFLILTYLPLYCIQVLHLSPTRMSIVMACNGAAGVASAIAVPYISDRVGRKPTLIVFCIISVLAAIAPLALGNIFGALTGCVFLGSLATGTTPLIMGTVPLETVPARYSAASSGVVLAAGSICGGFSGPALAGVLADHFGLSAPLRLAALMSICAGVSCLWLRETAPRLKKAPCPAMA